MTKPTTKEEFVKELKEMLADSDGLQKYEEMKSELEEVLKETQPFDPILCEHLRELMRVAENMKKYLFTMYK